MGNTESAPSTEGQGQKNDNNKLDLLLDKIPACGKVGDSEESPRRGPGGKSLQRIFQQAETLCAQSPNSTEGEEFAFGEGDDIVDRGYQEFGPRTQNNGKSSPDLVEPKSPTSTTNPTSALFARALVSEVTDNPKTMTPAQMAEREKKLLKAQAQAKKPRAKSGPRPVGAPGTVGQMNVLGSLAHAIPGFVGNPPADEEVMLENPEALRSIKITRNRPAGGSSEKKSNADSGKHTVTIGLSLSRRHASLGHPSTVTRQVAWDFNALQDREYKYVSSTDSTGWRAGGGERGGPPLVSPDNDESFDDMEAHQSILTPGQPKNILQPTSPQPNETQKIAAPDTVHISIIEIDAPSAQAVDEIIAALARGEIFVPHMSVLPEALSVNGVSPPDLVVRFGAERNDDLPPDEWPNWCLEFMHNQLYEYFKDYGAKWQQRPFSITLAKKVRWKTVKHMNRYFAHAERVIDAWREAGPQYLDPQLSYIEGGATPEEVARPHGIYLFIDGVPRHYFPPNFDPPYTTKMTRSLLQNVLDKSWDKKRREWISDPSIRLLSPGMLVTAMCGCADNTSGGFMANEVTAKSQIDTSKILEGSIMSRKQQGMSESEMDYTTGSGNVYATASNGNVHESLAHFETTGGKKSSSFEPHEASAGDLPAEDDYVNEETDGSSQQLNDTSMSEPVQPSVTGTNTTVMHMNISANSFVRKQLSSGTNHEEKKEETARDLDGDEQVSSRDVGLFDDEARTTQGSVSLPPVNESSSSSRVDLEGHHSTIDDGRRGRKKLFPGEAAMPGVQQTVSLEYSLDSAMVGDSSTVGGSLLGQNFTSDNSTYQTKANIDKIRQSGSESRFSTKDEDQLSTLSVQESTSSVEVVPSDEELFAIGWAKALDSKTGTHYYFTLDRSRNQWENPLASHKTTESENAI